MEKIVCVSEYFDPIHIGHLEYFKKSNSPAKSTFIVEQIEKIA